MRISDWSSDVCSSDLRLLHGERAVEGLVQEGVGIGGGQFRGRLAVALDERLLVGLETGLDLGRTGECSRRKQGEQQRRDGSAPRHIASHHIGGFQTSGPALRSEEHTSELQSLMRISYAVFCLKKTKRLQHK